MTVEVARSAGHRHVRSAGSSLRTGDGLDLATLVARDAGRDRHVPVAAIAEQVELYRDTASRAQLVTEGFAVVLEPAVTLAATG